MHEKQSKKSIMDIRINIMLQSIIVPPTKWCASMCLLLLCSQWGILPNADDKWQSTTRVWRILLHHWGNQQHHVGIHPQKHCKHLWSSPHNKEGTSKKKNILKCKCIQTTDLLTWLPFRLAGYICCGRLTHHGEDCLHLWPGGNHLELQAWSV